jgi:hypothetical protein
LNEVVAPLDREKKSIVINDIGLVCSQKKETCFNKKKTITMGWMLA